MRQWYISTHLATFLCVLPFLTGCGNQENEVQPVESIAPSPAPVDPRFATPAALVKYAKTIVDAPEPKMDDFYDLFQWENPVQETWSKYVRFIAVPHGTLKREFVRRFPSQPWPSDVPIHFFEIRIPDANVTSNDGERAQAVFRDRNGPQQVLHMVKQYGRWWISGFSLERAAKLDLLNKMAADTGQPLDGLLSAAAREHQGVLNLAQRLKSGNIKSVEQFWTEAHASFGEP